MKVSIKIWDLSGVVEFEKEVDNIPEMMAILGSIDSLVGRIEVVTLKTE